MNKSGHILVINPGSTSTKLAIYSYHADAGDLGITGETNLEHNQDHFSDNGPVLDQLSARLEAIHQFLESLGKDALDIQMIMARSAPLKPMLGGIYSVNEDMLEDLRTAKYSNHASNLAAILGEKIASEMGIPVFISDPITTDELNPLARFSGVPGIERKSRSHALNIKASTRKICDKHELPFEESNWVVCHMGGGISVAALKNGRIIDVNDALLGMGPFTPERAGALPIAGLLELAYSGEHDRASLESYLSRSSGLKGYLGTSDLKVIEARIQDGDEEAKLIYDAMVYQIAKEIGAMASVHAFHLTGVILTGGMANSTKLCLGISDRIATIADVYIEPGENELQALAEAGLRIVRGEEEVLSYRSDEDQN